MKHFHEAELLVCRKRCISYAMLEFIVNPKIKAMDHNQRTLNHVEVVSVLDINYSGQLPTRTAFAIWQNIAFSLVSAILFHLMLREELCSLFL